MGAGQARILGRHFPESGGPPHHRGQTANWSSTRRSSARCCLPTVSGDSRGPAGPVVNLSYWIYPAFARLPMVAPKSTGAASQSRSRRVEGVSLRHRRLAGADGVLCATDRRVRRRFPAIRIQRHPAFRSISHGPASASATLRSLRRLGDAHSRAPVVDVSTGRRAGAFGNRATAPSARWPCARRRDGRSSEHAGAARSETYPSRARARVTRSRSHADEVPLVMR